MPTAAAVWVDVLPSMKGFAAAMRTGVAPGAASAGEQASDAFSNAFSRDVGKEMRAATAKATRGMSVDAGNAGDQFGRKFSASAGAQFKKMAGAAVVAFGAVQAGAFFKDAISGASDLAETTSKIQQIFGDAAGEVQAFAASASTSLGQTKQQALDANATFGIFGKSAGLAGKDLTNFTGSLTTLATDLASFNNTSPEQAINAIGSALRGEAEPLRAYGVLLDDASMRQQALKMGLIATTKDALTPQQKVLSAQALIMDQTRVAQGDFARTSGGLANQQRILAARFSEAKTAIGAAFLPALTGLANYATGTFIPALGRLRDGFKTMTQGFGRGEFATDLANRFRNDFLPTFERVRDFVVTQAVPAILDFAGRIRDNLMPIVGALSQFFRERIIPAVMDLKGAWESAGPPILTVIVGIQAAVMWLASKAFGTLIPIILKVAGPIFSALYKAISFAIRVVGFLAQTIILRVKLAIAAFNLFKDAAVSVGRTVMDLWRTYVQPVTNFIGRAFTTLWRSFILPVFGAFKAGLGVIGSAVSAWWTANVRPTLDVVGDKFTWLWRNIIKPVFSGIGSVISSVWTGTIRPVFDTLFATVGKVGGAFQAAKMAVAAAWDGLKEAVRRPVQYVIDVVYNQGIRALWNRVIDKFGGTPLGAVTLGGGGGRMERRHMGRFQGFRAKGGYVAPGWAVVGEQGPELVNFSQPGRVYTADETTRMFGGFGGIMDDIRAGLRVATSAVGAPSAAGVVDDAFSMAQSGVGRIRETIANIGATEFAGTLKGMANKAVGALLDKAKGMAAAAASGATGALSSAALAALGTTLGGTVFPMRGGYRVGMPPAWRGGYQGHTGQDFPAPVGTPLYAPFTGLLQQVALRGSYGLHSNIYGPGGMRAILAHQSRFARGNGLVRAGELIGFVGSSGNSSGPHLHLEYRRNGRALEPRNITPFDSGGLLQPGYNLTYNGTGGPEAVLTRQQWATMRDAATVGAPNVQVLIDGREIESAVVRVSDRRDQALTNGLAYGQV